METMEKAVDGVAVVFAGSMDLKRWDDLSLFLAAI